MLRRALDRATRSAVQFGSDSSSYDRQFGRCGFPNGLFDHPLVIVPIEVAGICHSLPWHLWMSRLQLIWKPARCFRDDLQSARHGIECLQVLAEGLEREAFEEASSDIDIEFDID